MLPLFRHSCCRATNIGSWATTVQQKYAKMSKWATRKGK
jgi:hypothetical protein